MRRPVHGDVVSHATDVPQLLTVSEAAERLRIGRSLAYELARTYLTSGGVQGLPVIKLGARMRVPRWALDELARTGRLVRLGGPIAGESSRMVEPRRDRTIRIRSTDTAMAEHDPRLAGTRASRAVALRRSATSPQLRLLEEP
jgi:excisionase family DNA binding protein